MKIARKAIALLMAAAMVIGSATDIQAQKRRTGAKKRTTTTRTTAAAPLKAQNLAGQDFICFCELENAGTKFLMESAIYLKLGAADWDFGSSVFEGEWGVTGSTLKIKSGGLKITATSKDGGKTFTGKFQNGKNGAGDNCTLYNVTSNSSITPKDIQTGLTEGKYIGYMTLYNEGNPEIGCAVNVKFTPGAETNEGTYKVTGDHILMTAAGLLKGKYSFDEDNFAVEKISGDMKKYPYAKNTGYICINLGRKNIPDHGPCNLILYLFRK